VGIYLKGLDFYPALISREADHYVARFVDIPDCLAFGRTAIEAEIQAASMLAGHFRWLERHGRPGPSPSVVGDQGQYRGVRVAYVRSPIEHTPAQARHASIPMASAA
jgi:predicted RNase H-like HicB family nuclease